MGFGIIIDAITLEVMRIVPATGLFAVGVELSCAYIKEHSRNLRAHNGLWLGYYHQHVYLFRVQPMTNTPRNPCCAVRHNSGYQAHLTLSLFPSLSTRVTPSSF